MIDFNMLQSRLTLSQSGQDPFFLTSAINWELASIREIGTKIKEVESIY